MNRTQLEHIIRAASRISGDTEIVVIGSQAIHAHDMVLPPVAYVSEEADVYPRHHPDRADDIDIAIGELSSFHETFGYYAHGVSPRTAVLPAGWEQRLVRLSNPNTDGATGLCLDPHDLVLSKYAAGREKDVDFIRGLLPSLVDDDRSTSPLSWPGLTRPSKLYEGKSGCPARGRA